MSTSENLDAPPSDANEQYIEVWNDLVSAKHLTWSLITCGGAVAVALGLATLFSASLFMWGLGGAVVGFVACTVMFSPKRAVRIIEPEDAATQSRSKADGNVLAGGHA